MTIDPDDIDYIGDVAVNSGAPYKNAIPGLRELYAILQNLNIPDSQTADEIATALAADASAMATLQNAIEVLADAFHQQSNLNIPFTFEDATDWVTAAAGDPATSLTTISASDIDDDATFGPEWEQDSQTASVTVYQRTAFRPRRGRVYRVTIRGYVGGTNSCTLQAVVAQLNSSHVVTTANKASSQNLTWSSGANTEKSVTFTMSIDNAGADVDLDDVPYVRVGATLGPDTATSTNLRITEVHVEDVTEPFTNLSAAAIVALIVASASDLSSLKDAIVTDFDAADMQAIVADIDADATSEQNLATALAGNATARGILGAAFSGDIDAGAFSAGAVDLTTDVTGDLPFANFVAAGSAGFIGATGAGDYAHRTIAQTQGDLSVDDLITTSGVSEGSTHLGTFTGSTISDNGTIKAGMQELETAIEGITEGLELVASGTVSAAAAFAVTGLSSTYSAYLLVFQDLVPATDATNLYLRTSTDGGSSYDSGASDYSWARPELSGAAYNYEVDTADTKIDMLRNCSNVATEPISGTIWIYNPSDAGEYTRAKFDVEHVNSSSAMVRGVGMGERLSAADVDAFQILFSSGNVTTMDYWLYGLRAS